MGDANDEQAARLRELQTYVAGRVLREENRRHVKAQLDKYFEQAFDDLVLKALRDEENEKEIG